MSTRPRLRRCAFSAIAVTGILLLTACELGVYQRADDARGLVDLAPLDRSVVLADAARANSAALCAVGAVTPSDNAVTTYGLQTITDAAEIVGRAPLDPTITDPLQRNIAATNEILDSWANPPWTGSNWDDIGVGEVECADNHLYLTAVVIERPTMPATGRYSSIQYPLAQIGQRLDVQYGTAINYRGQRQPLLLDIYLPPSHGADRPLVILVHGGGFAKGNKANMAATAQSYARRGYVAVSLGYRLNPTLPGASDLPAYLAAATNAVDDGMESVRWLKANAATYEIDVNRIAMLGSSAGGGVALGVATMDDPTPGGPLASYSPQITAAVATGATLVLGLDTVPFDQSDSPIMMLHYEEDPATFADTADVMATCDAVWAVGVNCDPVIIPGEGHTTNLSAGGQWWSGVIGPYLWHHLGL